MEYNEFLKTFDGVRSGMVLAAFVEEVAGKRSIYARQSRRMHRRMLECLNEKMNPAFVQIEFDKDNGILWDIIENVLEGNLPLRVEAEDPPPQEEVQEGGHGEEGDESESEGSVAKEVRALGGVVERLAKQLDAMTTDVKGLKRNQKSKKSFVDETVKRMGGRPEDGEEVEVIEQGSEDSSEEEEEDKRARATRKRRAKKRKRKGRRKKRGYGSSDDSSSSDSDTSDSSSSDDDYRSKKSRNKKSSSKKALKKFWEQQDRRKHVYVTALINRVAQEKLCFILMDFKTVTQYVKGHDFNNERNRRECEVIGQSIDMLLAEVGTAKGRKLDAVEVLVRRLVQVEAADRERTWETAKHLFDDETSIALTTGKEMRAARKQAKWEKGPAKAPVKKEGVKPKT